MLVLINLIFALLFGWLALWVAGKARAPEPVAWIIAVIVGLIVFSLNLAAQVTVL